MQFHGLHGETIVAKLGDYVTVPTRAPHTFSNPYEEEAKFFNTYTPAHYINYFKLLATLGEAVRQNHLLLKCSRSNVLIGQTHEQGG